MDSGTRGRGGERIASLLWPQLKLQASGNPADRQGIDGFLDGIRVQIKTDETIATSGNIFHELYKKNGAWASYGTPNEFWRRSPSDAEIYIFVTVGAAHLIWLHFLAMAETGKFLRQISDTAIGFVVPLKIIREKETRPHTLWSVYCQ